MNKTAYLFIYFLLVFITSDSLAQHHTGILNGDGKNPVTAALLSIQPLPVAMGNFYAGNWERGVMYTAAELALFIPAAVLLGRNNWGMSMHNDYYYENSDDRRWSKSERNTFFYLLSGYFLIKIISAFDAGYSAEKYNENFSIKYDAMNNTANFTLNIPVR